MCSVKLLNGGWGDNSQVLGSVRSSQLSLTPVQGHLIPSSALCGQQSHAVHRTTYMQAKAHTNKIKINIFVR